MPNCPLPVPPRHHLEASCALSRNLTELAQRYGVVPATMARWLKAHGLIWPPPRGW